MLDITRCLVSDTYTVLSRNAAKENLALALFSAIDVGPLHTKLQVRFEIWTSHAAMIHCTADYLIACT